MDLWPDRWRAPGECPATESSCARRSVRTACTGRHCAARRLVRRQPLQRRGCGQRFILDPHGLDGLARLRQVDDQGAAEDGIGFLKVKRPADPRGLTLGGRAQHIRGLLAHVSDHQVLGVEHQLRRTRIEPLEIERGDAADRFALHIDPQVQVDVSDPKLIDIGEGVLIGGECRQARSASASPPKPQPIPRRIISERKLGSATREALRRGRRPIP